MTSAVGAFSDAIMARLAADTGIIALVGRQVFDQVPGKGGALPGVSPPWIYLGPCGAARFEDSAYRAWMLTLRIYCETIDFNRGPAWAIADAVDAALDGARPALSSPFGLQADLRMTNSGDIIDPDKPKSVFCDVTGIVYRDMPFLTGPSI